jgi:thaumarchaeosortase
MTIPLKEQIKNFLSRLEMFLSRIDWYFFLQTALLFAAFIVPLGIIYSVDWGSFEVLWKGRAPHLLFLWLFFLEAALGWKKLKKEQPKFWTKKTVLVAVTLLLPTIYAVGLKFDLQSGIVALGRAVGVPLIDGNIWYLTHSWLFSLEYVLFAAFFVASIWLLYGFRGLKIFSVSAFFFVGVGVFYMIDSFYPNGTFAALQFLVPITTSAVALILNLLGYETDIQPGINETLNLEVTKGTVTQTAGIAWSCAGSHSLFLYSFMIMLFLRGTSISRTRKIIYVAGGAAGTFFVNILRIVTFYVIGINSSESLANLFHEVYGEFFFIAWMFIYLTVIFLFETRLIGKITGTQKRDQSPMGTAQSELPHRLERDKSF